MSTYTIYDSEKIISIISTTPEGLLLNLQDGQSYVEGEFGDDLYYVRDGIITAYPPKTIEPAYFDKDANTWVYDSVAAYGILRRDRQMLLASSDWTQAVDSPLTDAKKAEWATYRQQLRDLPANTTDPANPTWPTPPS